MSPPTTTLTPNPSSLPNLDFSNWGAESLQFVVVDPHRIAWIRPPPVIRAPAGRKWEKWVEKNVEGQLFVVKSGCSHSDVESASYFDRSNNREVILLEGIHPLPGAVSEHKVFGFPCPQHLHFAETPQNKNPRPAKASSWLYLTRDPISRDVGLNATTPDAESLPFKDDFGTRESGPPPSPPPSPGHPTHQLPASFISFDPLDSPVIGSINNSARPISPIDSLLESPPPVDWVLADDSSMGPQIPGLLLEDIEMSTVDLGNDSPELTARSPPQIESPQPTLSQSPSLTTATQSFPSSSRHVRREVQPSSRSASSRDYPKRSRRSPHRQSNGRVGRQRSRTPSPFRRRVDSYRPDAFPSHHQDKELPRGPSNPRIPPDTWPTTPSLGNDPWLSTPTSNPWSSVPAPGTWSSPNMYQPGRPPFLGVHRQATYHGVFLNCLMHPGLSIILDTTLQIIFQ
jgi:hypothetical protein